MKNYYGTLLASKVLLLLGISSDVDREDEDDR